MEHENWVDYFYLPALLTLAISVLFGFPFFGVYIGLPANVTIVIMAIWVAVGLPGAFYLNRRREARRWDERWAAIKRMMK